MKKTNFLFLLLLFMTNQSFAQQSQSFNEYWFGVKPQNAVQKSTKSTVRKAPVKQHTVKANANGIITLDLSQPINPSSFDVNENGVWTETYNDVDYTFFEVNAPFSFSHIIEGVGASFGGYYWDGFTYSKNGDNTDYGSEGDSQGWVANQWGNMAGGGIVTDAEGNVLKDENGVVLTDASIPYLLAFWGFGMEPEYFENYWGSLSEPTHNLQTIFTDGNAYEAVGVYINNSPWPYYGNINGDGFARALDKEGDYFKLIIHGLDNNYEETGKSVEHYLAKYENGELIQSPNWEWVDLSDLGEIGGLYYTMETTDTDPMWGPNTAVYFCMDKLQVKIPNNYSITVPSGSDVFVGRKTKHFVPFTEIEATAIIENEDSKTYYYNLASGTQYNYRINSIEKVTQAGIFTMNNSLTPMFVTEEMLIDNPKQLDRVVSSNSGTNVADVFLNVDATGQLNLAIDETFQLVNLRTWQLVDNVINNYFIEPDFHYVVLDENGNQSNEIIEIDSNGKITALTEGVAIVVVSYDAIDVKSAMGGSLFGAIWAENSGVFVVKVGEENSNTIISNMLINEDKEQTGKIAGYNVDAELDVFYYLEEDGAYLYTFAPDGVDEVSIAQPTIDNDLLTFNSFTTTGVTNFEDGTYSVQLTEGKNIIKLSSGDDAIYQVLKAKSVSYTIENITSPGSVVKQGDEIAVKFNNLYHPVNKLAGVYNMSANIQYEANGELIKGGKNQYTFASTEAAQTIKFTIPSDWDISKSFDLTKGAINVTGFGDPYGGHREITLDNGKNPNFNAQSRNAFFGALPKISIEVKSSTATGIESVIDNNLVTVFPNPASHNIALSVSGDISIFSATGTLLSKIQDYEQNSLIDVSNWEKGVYFIKVGHISTKFIKN